MPLPACLRLSCTPLQTLHPAAPPFPPRCTVPPQSPLHTHHRCFKPHPPTQYTVPIYPVVTATRRSLKRPPSRSNISATRANLHMRVSMREDQRSELRTHSKSHVLILRCGVITGRIWSFLDWELVRRLFPTLPTTILDNNLRG